VLGPSFCGGVHPSAALHQKEHKHNKMAKARFPEIIFSDLGRDEGAGVDRAGSAWKDGSQLRR
jgi:hypothetical protein